MSIENAILELAAAINNLAASNRPQVRSEATTTTAGVSIAEQEKVMEQVAADRKPSTAKEAINDALARAKAERAQSTVDSIRQVHAQQDAENKEQEESAALLEDVGPLDWKADVMPVLQQVGKDKTKLAGLLADFDVGAGKTYKTANLLPTEVYPQLVDAANKLLGK